jgi:hypothetical protein
LDLGLWSFRCCGSLALCVAAVAARGQRDRALSLSSCRDSTSSCFGEQKKKMGTTVLVHSCVSVCALHRSSLPSRRWESRVISGEASRFRQQRLFTVKAAGVSDFSVVHSRIQSEVCVSLLPTTSLPSPLCNVCYQHLFLCGSDERLVFLGSFFREMLR